MAAVDEKVGGGSSWPYRVGLLLSLAYCFAAGVLGLGSSAQIGIDFSVCYVVGVTSTRGSSPYSLDELTNTRRTMPPALAAKPSYPFAYPPSAIPACVLLSLLPWEAAHALWKLLNLAFLIGSVLLTFRLFSGLPVSPNDRYLAWSFAFIFSPTVSVLLVGQSSLFVLFTSLLTMLLYHRGKPWSAGLSLALALTKPHLAFPLACLLLFRRQYRIVITAIATFAVLVIAGLWIGHSDIDTYLQGVRTYAAWNSATNPRLVGIQNLTTGVLGLSPLVGSTLSLIGGLLLLGITLLLDSEDRRRGRTGDALPLALLVTALAFKAHSYDLVLLIPVCLWAMAGARADRRLLPIAVLCFLLIIPLSAVAIVYEKLLSPVVPLTVFRVVLEPYRSWILLIMAVLAMYVTYRRIAEQRVGKSAISQ